MTTWAYVIDDGHGRRRLIVVEEDEQGNVLADLLLYQLDAADPDRALAHHRWRRVSGKDWEDTGAESLAAPVVRMRGGGTGPARRVDVEPRDVRFPLRLPRALRDELATAAAAAGRSVNDEIIARCAR